VQLRSIHFLLNPRDSELNILFRLGTSLPRRKKLKQPQAPSPTAKYLGLSNQEEWARGGNDELALGSNTKGSQQKPSREDTDRTAAVVAATAQQADAATSSWKKTVQSGGFLVVTDPKKERRKQKALERAEAAVEASGDDKEKTNEKENKPEKSSEWSPRDRRPGSSPFRSKRNDDSSRRAADKEKDKDKDKERKEIKIPFQVSGSSKGWDTSTLGAQVGSSSVLDAEFPAPSTSVTAGFSTASADTDLNMRN